MIERYQDNLKGKLIEYQGRKLYVIDQVFHKGDYYVYTYNVEKYEANKELEINFLKKVNGLLEVVTDMQLFDKLLASVGSNFVAEQIKKFNSKSNK